MATIEGVLGKHGTTELQFVDMECCVIRYSNEHIQHTCIVSIAAASWGDLVEMKLSRAMSVSDLWRVSKGYFRLDNAGKKVIEIG